MQGKLADIDRKFYPNIQALRFVAAFSVVAFHVSNIYFHQQWDGWLSYALAPFRYYGFAGVDVFFVISGFVMWHTTEKAHAPADAPFFALRRAARIFVGYWPWLAVMAWVQVFTFGRPVGDFNWISSISLLRLGGYSELVLPTAWTLIFELMFYLALAGSMFLPRKLAFCAIVVWGAVSLTEIDGTLWLFPFITEFVIGVVLYAWLRRKERPPFVLAGMLLIFGVAVGLFAYEPESLTIRVLTLGMMAAGLVTFAVALERSGITASGIALLLGDASYALYLCHYPMLEYLKAHRRIWHEIPDIALALAIVASVVVSIVWYLALERPVYRKAIRLIETLRRSAPLASSA